MIFYNMNLESHIFVNYRLNKQISQEPYSEEFKAHGRHYFLFTRYGKPVFCRYGEEVNCSGLMASLSTIIEKYQLVHRSKLREEGNEEEEVEGIQRMTNG